MSNNSKNENRINQFLMVSYDELKQIIVEIVREEREQTEKRIRESREVAAVSRNDASKMLSVSLNTLWRWEKDGYLVPKRVGTKVMYLKSDIEKLITKR